MKKISLGLTATALAISLTACGSSDWPEEERLEAWHKQQCSELSALDGVTQAKSLNIDILSDSSMSRADRLEAMDNIDRLERSRTVGSVIDPDGDLECEGWLWEHKMHDNIPESFTQEVAEQRGLL